MRRIPLLAAATALIAAPLLGESVQTFLGNTSDGPTWHRPHVGDPPSSIIGTSTPRYSVQAFKVLADSRCYVVSAQSFDGTIHLYRHAFSSGSPLSNIVSGNDDGIHVALNSTSYLPNAGPGHLLTLPADTYYLVTSGYSTNESGAFQNTIHCEPIVGSASTAVLVQGSCGAYLDVPVLNTVCLRGAFLMAIYDVTNSSNGGFGVPVRTGSIDTGLFWFYNDTNWEVMVKVLNACVVNGHYWVFGGALTNQGYNIVVTDTQLGGQRHYINHLGTRAPAIADTTAFNCP